MRVRMDDEQSTEVQMGPLIDCVFLLLIFFIVIAVTKKSIEDLRIELPEPGQVVSEISPKDNQLLFRVTQNGDVYIGDAPAMGPQEVYDAIARKRDTDPDTVVRFEIDRRAQFEDFFYIMDKLKLEGFDDWSFRVNMQDQD